MRYSNSIYAGMLIGLGAVANLAVGGLAGAILFSFALLMICALQYELFTGKVGATMLGEYKITHLALAYLGNAQGILFILACALFSPIADSLIAGAQAIADIRLTNHWIANIAMGILCGVCVQLAVDGWKATKHPLTVMLPVIVFVTGKTNHCIADMFYLWLSGTSLKTSLWPLFCTTLGNIIGAGVLTLGKLQLADDAHKH